MLYVKRVQYILVLSLKCEKFNLVNVSVLSIFQNNVQ